MKVAELAWVPYIFTSFSNRNPHSSFCLWLEYHTFLHHSQTNRSRQWNIYRLEYHTFLHHSQTGFWNEKCHICLSTIHFYIILKHPAFNLYKQFSLSTIHFYIILKPSAIHKTFSRQLEYHTFLHHSQTHTIFIIFNLMLEYHTFLHHSQTWEQSTQAL